MRIVQLIDSLAAGGAERMAVNYANALANRGFSALVSTRDEGPLLTELDRDVIYMHLNKIKAVDLKALSAFRKFCIDNQIQVIHAHSTSYFFAVMLKLRLPQVRIVWHDHFGLRDKQKLRQNWILYLCARYFWGAIVVNKALAEWSKGKLGIKRVLYLPNFTRLQDTHDTVSLGGENGKRIVCIANLKVPKNHHLIVRVATEVIKRFPEWTFHFVGVDYSDTYSAELKKMIAEAKLQSHVFIHGQRFDIKSVIDSCEIGVIASDYEGLPVALLEYGICKKAVVATAVGQIPEILVDGENGLLINPGADQQLLAALTKLIADQNLRQRFALNLNFTITTNHSEDAIVAAYLDWLSN